MNGPSKNTDREIWRGPDEGNGDFYAHSMFITEQDKLGINCGGTVFVLQVDEWHRLALSALAPCDAEPVEAPSMTPMVQSNEPAWVQINNLFQRHGLPNPPWQLRDELVALALWAWHNHINRITTPPNVREQTIRECAEKVQDYANDALPDSEYRLACSDIIEALSLLKEGQPS